MGAYQILLQITELRETNLGLKIRLELEIHVNFDHNFGPGFFVQKKDSIFGQKLIFIDTINLVSFLVI